MFLLAATLSCRSAPCARDPFASVFGSVVPAQAGRSAKRAERQKGSPEGASEASHPLAPGFDRCVPANLPPTQRAFRRPAGRRVTFLLLAHARAFCVRTAKPARRAEGASPESKKVTQRKWPSEPGLVAIRGIEPDDGGQSGYARYYLERRGYTATRRCEEGLKRDFALLPGFQLLALPFGERAGVRGGCSRKDGLSR